MQHKSLLDKATSYLPLAVMAVSLVSGYTMLQSRVSSAEEKIKDIEGVKLSQAKMEAQLDYIYQAIKDAKTR